MIAGDTGPDETETGRRGLRYQSCLGGRGIGTPVEIQLHIPIEIVPPAFGQGLESDGNGEGGTPFRFTGFFDQAYSGLIGRPSALFVITWQAGCYDILPGFFPAT